MGLVSEETVVLRRWGSDTRKFGLSTELIMKIDHRTEIEKLTFRALALRSDDDKPGSPRRRNRDCRER